MAKTSEAFTSRPVTTESPPADPSVLAIVVTHRGRRWIRDCLVGLNTQTYPHLDVLVVDDSSPDFRDPPHLKRIVKRHVRSRRWGFLRTPRPLGFGGAINWALGRVRTDAELLLFIHDDAALDPGSVARLVDRIQTEPDTAIVGPKVVGWDDARRLEEVGMAMDRFGYPYKGLEEDEIDLGQHDTTTEVFFVTSTCMLVRHDVFRNLRGWDVRMRAFSEDLDLCWRARVAGYSVRVEPRATARHAVALARGHRESRFVPTRYYGRRNRLRAVAKNVSGPRLVWLLPQFVLVTFAEMLGFIVLRQPREILNLGRALAWNALTFPQIFSERTRVQGSRRVADRSLNRLTVRQSTRIRSYITYQAGRLDQAWGRRAQFLGRRTSQARTVGASLVGWPLVLSAVVVIGMVLGFRHFLWGPAAVTGSLVPFPPSALGMFKTFFSPWLPGGLGQPGPAPPAFLMLGIFPMITLGAAGAAQKLLVAGLGATAFVGAYRMIADLVDRPARVIAGLAYVLGGVGYAGIRGGSLEALVFGAMAPFALHSLLKLSGWVRPRSWKPEREIARLAIPIAISGAFAPGSLVLYAGTALVIVGARLPFSSLAAVMRALLLSLAGIAVGLVLLLPWSLTWTLQGGLLDRVMGDQTWRNFATSFSNDSPAGVLSAQTPNLPPLAGLALVVLGFFALTSAQGQRRRVALVLWAIVSATALFVALVGAGAIRPLVAAPSVAAVPASVAFAGLAGLAVGAIRLDLPRRGFGWIHAVTIGGVATAGLLVVFALAPAMWRGEWTPGGARGHVEARTVATIDSILTSEAATAGQFRVLWVGHEWREGAPSALRPTADYFVTGPQGLLTRDLFARNYGGGDRDLATVVASIQEGSTDRGGRLLGAFNIHFVVVEPGPGEDGWLSQRDLALRRSEPDYLILENAVQLPRAGVYTDVPIYVRALEAGDPTFVPDGSEVERVAAMQETPSLYTAATASGPGAVFLAESRDPAWTGAVGEHRLVKTSGGWGNSFAIPAEAQGDLVITHPRSVGEWLWLVFFFLAWTVVLGAAFSRRKVREGR